MDQERTLDDRDRALQESERLERMPIWESLLLPVATLLFYLVTAEGYGYFRDELYYLANGEHLGWGYVDHPPLIGFLAWLVTQTLGTSLLAIRTLPALAAAVTVWLSMQIAAELGGGRKARWMAGIVTALAPGSLAMSSFFSMNAFDIVFWAALWWISARYLRTRQERLWIAFGIVAGLGLLNKISVLFLGFGLVVGLVLCRRWDVYRSSKLWLGGALAFLLFSPHLIWQIFNGWPTMTFMENARRFKMLSMSPPQFLSEQVLLGGPVALPVWVAGIAGLLLVGRFRTFRPLGWAFVTVLVFLIATGGKPYYFVPAFALAFGAGAVMLERWAARGTLRSRIAVAYTVLLIVCGIGVAPMAKPLLPVETFVRYQEVIGLSANSGERHEVGRLPQFFADMHGWRELAEEVAGVYRSLPAPEQEEACVFGQNYGQAGAIDLFGPPLGLPKAVSGHNSYHLWGYGECSGDVVIVIGDRAEVLEQLFESVEHAKQFTCSDCMPYEADKPIWIARGLRGGIAAMWPRVRNFN